MYGAFLRGAVYVFINPSGNALSCVTMLLVAKCILLQRRKTITFLYCSREKNDDKRSDLFRVMFNKSMSFYMAKHTS